MNFPEIISKALPWITAAASGNVPGLVVLAAKTVGEVLGKDIAPNAEDIAAAIQGATPEQMSALRDREYTFRERMQEMGYKHVEELGRQDIQRETIFVTDTADARKVHGGNESVFWLAVAILGCFAVCVLVVMVGCFMLLTKSGTFADVDPAAVGMVSGLIGTIIGYAAANAQQVVSYFFGSSQGSKSSGDALRQSFSEALKKLSER